MNDLQASPEASPEQSQNLNPLQNESEESQNLEAESQINGEATSEVGESTASKEDRELDFAKRFNQLTQYEKKQREKYEQLKNEKEELRKLREPIENLKNNPIKALEAAGWTFKDLAEHILNDEKPTTEQKLKNLEELILNDKKEREEKLSAEQERQKKEAEEQAQQRIEREIKAAKDQIAQIVDESEEFELIKEQGAQDLVWDVVENYFEETKEILDFKVAAQRVEEYLTEQVEKLISGNKFKSKYQPIPEPKEDVSLGDNFYMKRHLEEKYGRSLSNDMVRDGNRVADDSTAYMSDDEARHHLSKKLERMLQQGN